MTSWIPSHAMILGAGYGLRMRPLTLNTPKVLLTVGEKTLLDHAIDQCVSAGITHIVTNAHHHKEQIISHLRQRPGPLVLVSKEDPLLETGGGVKKALPLLGPDPFFVINGDFICVNGPVPVLNRLAQHWDPTRMDVLLLLIPHDRVQGLSGRGDYFLEPDGRVRRRVDPAERAPYFYAAIQVTSPYAYRDTPSTAFSNLLVWDRAQAEGRLYGLVHDGLCYHVGDPKALADANAQYRAPAQ